MLRSYEILVKSWAYMVWKKFQIFKTNQFSFSVSNLLQSRGQDAEFLLLQYLINGNLTDKVAGQVNSVCEALQIDV